MIELVKGTNFSDHITKIHGSDALNRTKQQALDIGMPNIHGHHVKYKKAITDEDVLVQNTLMDYGIDPIYAKEVLVFAPNRGHTLAVNIGVGDSVRNAVEVARKQNLSYDETRQKIILALQQEAEDFIQSAWPDYFKHRIQK